MDTNLIDIFIDKNSLTSESINLINNNNDYQYLY